MPVGDNYYQLLLTIPGSSTSAYIYVDLASSGAFGGGAATIYPTSTSATYVNFNSIAMQMQTPPAGSISASVSVVTSANNVAGTLGISPSINSDATLSLYGNGGLIGSTVLKAGQTSMPYDFQVSSSQAFASQDAASQAFTQRPPAEA